MMAEQELEKVPCPQVTKDQTLYLYKKSTCHEGESFDLIRLDTSYRIALKLTLWNQSQDVPSQLCENQWTYMAERKTINCSQLSITSDEKGLTRPSIRDYHTSKKYDVPSIIQGLLSLVRGEAT